MNPIGRSLIQPARHGALAAARRFAIGLVLLFALVAIGRAPLQAQPIVAPNTLAELDGNTHTTTPAGTDSGIRIMYLYDASQFQALAGPAYLTGFAYRPDRTPDASGPKPLTAKVYVSTTTRSPGECSTRFRDNIGADNTLVFEGTVTLSTANQPGPGNTRQFDYAWQFTHPFLYDPRAGNLVLDLQILQGTGPAIRFDAVAGSPVARNVSAQGAPNATIGQFYEAPVLRFNFEPAPAILIRTSQVELCWASVPGASYRVEFRTDAASDVWESLVDCVRATLETTTCIRDEVERGAPRRFYRVVRTDCTP
jgi:hypothetical protein